MAGILPNPFALKSNSNHRYLCCGADGLLQFTDQVPTSFFTTEGGNLRNVNVKGPNGKYWVRAVPDQDDPPYEIRCTADTAHEAIDKKCTMFEYKIVEQSNPTQVVLQFLHVQLQLHLRPTDFQSLKDVLCGVDPIPDSAVDPSPDVTKCETDSSETTHQSSASPESESPPSIDSSETTHQSSASPPQKGEIDLDVIIDLLLMLLLMCEGRYL